MINITNPAAIIVWDDGFIDLFFELKKISVRSLEDFRVMI